MICFRHSVLGIRESFWIGGTNLGYQQWTTNFYWLGSNNSMTYTDWGQDEPNNWGDGLENCVAIKAHVGYKWNDRKCTVLNYFICEEQITPTNHKTDAVCSSAPTTMKTMLIIVMIIAMVIIIAVTSYRYQLCRTKEGGRIEFFQKF